MEQISRLSARTDIVAFRNRYLCMDGSCRWLEWNARLVPGSNEIYAIARDISHQRGLEKEILEISDREKEHFGRELHDGLCQTLAGIAALSTTLSRSLGSDTASAAAAAEISSLLHETIEEARNLARGIGSPGMKNAGIQEILEVLAVNTQQRFRISCSFDSDNSLECVTHEVGNHLYRIAQEAINNAIFHGEAGSIHLKLSFGNGGGCLRILDDGIGLPEDTTQDFHGIGLHTMAYRANLIGGNLKLGRRKQKGTEVSCKFPIPVSFHNDEVPSHE
jgi:signal transduction histidine kinase